jgi:adenylyl- and sulfurtransferase ThiI
MPWDSTDKFRDEDLTERRKKSRRRFKIGGRRKTDNHPRSSAEEQRFPKA